MLDMYKQNKKLLILFVVVTIVFAWFMLSGGSNSSKTLTVTSVKGTSSVNDQRIMKLLIDMRSIQLDGSVFKSPAFLLLQDFSRDIVQEPIGRTNPFAPIDRTLKASKTDITNGTLFK